MDLVDISLPPREETPIDKLERLISETYDSFTYTESANCVVGSPDYWLRILDSKAGWRPVSYDTLPTNSGLQQIVHLERKAVFGETRERLLELVAKVRLEMAKHAAQAAGLVPSAEELLAARQNMKRGA